MKYHKILVLLLFFVNASYAENIYKVEIIIIKFDAVVSDERFIKNFNFNPESIEVLKENEILLIPEKFLNNALSAVELLDLNFDENESNLEGNEKIIIKEVFNLYEYTDLDNLDFLIGRLRWRENIEILDSISWYQPLRNKNDFTYHYDEENNISLYLNFYQSRYLHLNLKAFIGNLNSKDEINEFIDEDRRIKNSEINYFDHPNIGVIVEINKT